MDFKGKLAFLVFMMVVVLGCLGSSANADGVQPCKYIKVKEMENGNAECAKCCEDNGLIKGTTVNACRCITHFSN